MHCSRSKWFNYGPGVCTLLLLMGCAEKSQLLQITGKITVDGKPANGASVLYFPQGGDLEDVAAGAADTNGVYALVSNLQPGVAPGKYKITVTWPAPAKAGGKSSVMGDIKDPPDLLKGRYADPNRTPLSADITASTGELPPLVLTTR